MKVRICSFRGDHNADADVAVAEAIFNKVTGKTKAALPEALKTQIPDTFQELKSLWTEGELKGHTPFGVDKDGNMVPMKEFNPEVAEMIVLQPIQGG